MNEVVTNVEVPRCQRFLITIYIFACPRLWLWPVHTLHVAMWKRRCAYSLTVTQCDHTFKMARGPRSWFVITPAYKFTQGSERSRDEGNGRKRNKERTQRKQRQESEGQRRTWGDKGNRTEDTEERRWRTQSTVRLSGLDGLISWVLQSNAEAAEDHSGSNQTNQIGNEWEKREACLHGYQEQELK